MFDGENGIALHTVQGYQASSRCEGDVSWFYSSCGGNLGYILELRQEWPFKTRVSSATSGLLCSCEGHLVFSSMHGRAIETPLKVRQGSFPAATGILGFLLISKSSQASSPF